MRRAVLTNSKISGFAAGKTILSGSGDLQAAARLADNLETLDSIPQGSLHIRGNISPGTNKQQGVLLIIDSSEFQQVINLMMEANPKRTMAAISSALASCAEKWPEEHWKPFKDE